MLSTLLRAVDSDSTEEIQAALSGLRTNAAIGTCASILGNLFQIRKAWRFVAWYSYDSWPGNHTKIGLEKWIDIFLS